MSLNLYEILKLITLIKIQKNLRQDLPKNILGNLKDLKKKILTGNFKESDQEALSKIKKIVLNNEEEKNGKEI